MYIPASVSPATKVGSSLYIHKKLSDRENYCPDQVIFLGPDTPPHHSILGFEVCAVINYRLFEAPIAGEVVVRPAMARHATGHQELLSRRQIADLLGFAGGIGPGPHRELEYKVVACGEGLFWSDETSLTEVSSYA